MLTFLVHFSSYKALPHTKGYSHDQKSHYVIASDLRLPGNDIITVEVSKGLGKA